MYIPIFEEIILILNDLKKKMTDKEYRHYTDSLYKHGKFDEPMLKEVQDERNKRMK